MTSPIATALRAQGARSRIGAAIEPAFSTGFDLISLQDIRERFK